MASFPVLDLSRWRGGSADDRRAFSADIDAAFQDLGFVMVTGHGAGDDDAEAVRRAARQVFALSPEVRARYTTGIAGRGWIPMGKEANSYYGVDADPTRADLKETWVSGRAMPTGDPVIDDEWFRPNVWPDEVPELAEACDRYASLMRDAFRDLLCALSVALGMDEDWLLSRACDAVETFNINRYPSRHEVGTVRDGQYRIAPHTDWGLLTLLDRQPGYGGLQIETRDGRWVDAPHVPGALTVNAADLLLRWTAGRWRSSRHRVLAPSEQAPDEELISLILFYEADADALIEPLPQPIGRGEHYEPIVAADYVRARAAAASVG